MARGFDRHKEREAAVAGLGRELSRRASNRCELCEARTSLQVVEVEPLPEEPEAGSAIIVCERCRRALEGGRGAPPAQELRFLEGSAWSQTVPVQIAAVRILRRLADAGEGWAHDLLDGLYLAPEVEERL